MQLKVCSNDDNPLCCIAKYEYSETETDGVFSLGVYKGIHTRDGSVRETMGFGICTILKCNARTSNQCDSYVSILIRIIFRDLARNLKSLIYGL